MLPDETVGVFSSQIGILLALVLNQSGIDAVAGERDGSSCDDELVEATIGFYETRGTHIEKQDGVFQEPDEIYQLFLRALPPRFDLKILDAGAGVGTDAVVFRSVGHQVHAYDASPAMVQALQVREIEADLQRFDEIEYRDRFDGVWAPSLVHAPLAQLREIIQRHVLALKEGGVLFIAFLPRDTGEEKQVYFKGGPGHLKGRLWLRLNRGDLEEILREIRGIETLEVSDKTSRGESAWDPRKPANWTRALIRRTR